MVEQILSEMRAMASVERAQKSAKYLQTHIGGYGYPDLCLGLTNPQIRMFAKAYKNLELREIRELFEHDYHEVRLFAVIVMNEQGKKMPSKRQEFYELYREMPRCLNNWDLVDTFGPHTVGPFLYETQDVVEVWRLAESEYLFEQRMAVISQFAWIQAGDDTLLHKLAVYFLNHPHDLMHKAVGWLLREAGKRNSENLYQFLDTYAPHMPRTMLRYAIEKLPESIRKQYLSIKRVVKKES